MYEFIIMLRIWKVKTGLPRDNHRIKLYWNPLLGLRGEIFIDQCNLPLCDAFLLQNAKSITITDIVPTLEKVCTFPTIK